MNPIDKQQDRHQKDPCWHVTLKDKSIAYEDILKREERERHGYPVDISLSEAIRIFNQEKQCLDVLAAYPLLTEEEVIAAIVAGPDNITPGEAWEHQKSLLWKIATQKILPKGSLLVATTGSRIQDSPLRPNGTIRAEGISIVIRFGLENHEPGKILRPDQLFVVRRTFFGIQTIK